MSADHSLAEAFARGLRKVEYPPDDVPVYCSCRISPARIETDGPFRHFKDPCPFGWTIVLDYINADRDEIIHRIEVTRSTKREIAEALPDVIENFPDRRERLEFGIWFLEDIERLVELLKEK
jgi:hypothetical protein